VKTPSERATGLAHLITAALLLLKMEREVIAGDDTVTVGDLLLRWTETWTQLASGGGERRSATAGWEIRLLPAALASGIIHNDRSAVQQVAVMLVLDAIWPALEDSGPATSTPYATVD